MEKKSRLELQSNWEKGIGLKYPNEGWLSYVQRMEREPEETDDFWTRVDAAWSEHKDEEAA